MTHTPASPGHAMNLFLSLKLNPVQDLSQIKIVSSSIL